MKFRIQLEEAVSIMTEVTRKIDETEEVVLEEGNGRILGEDIYAPVNNPPFDRSPLDGYAVIAEDTKGACRDNPVTLRVIDEVFAGGCSKKTLKTGEAVRIMTGAKLPSGCDAVIKQENTDEGMNTVEIYEELKKHSNYCFEGEDIAKGNFLMKKGDVLSYVHIGILSSMGYSKIKVKRNINAALLVTGDEVG
ncbi:MAG: molybdopterin molybdotransferase MoeA, partial [Clostridium sp.]